MTILRDISLIWSLVHILVLFIFFYESRYTRKKTLLLTFCAMIPLGIANVAGVILLGPELMGQLLLFTCTLPSAVYFFFIAKNRNWKFLFTFCIVDTVSYEILIISNIVDFYFFGEKYIAMLIIRLVAFPVMEWIAYKYIRKPFLEIKRTLKSGWALFTVVTVIYYVLLLIMTGYPTIITSRTEDLLALLLVLILMPITYVGIFLTLRNQMKIVNAENREHILDIQASALEQRVEEINQLEERLKISRHDMRHSYSVISEMLSEGKTEDALSYINDTSELMSSSKETLYCSHPVINAVFTYFVRKAEENDISVQAELSVPAHLELNATELSVAIANAFENAINACCKLPKDKRSIKCQSVSSPQFVLKISNTFDGDIAFDDNGLPKSNRHGHGVGVHSIVAFCEKNNVYYEFKVQDGYFTFAMIK